MHIGVSHEISRNATDHLHLVRQDSHLTAEQLPTMSPHAIRIIRMPYLQHLHETARPCPCVRDSGHAVGRSTCCRLMLCIGASVTRAGLIVAIHAARGEGGQGAGLRKNPRVCDVGIDY